MDVPDEDAVPVWSSTFKSKNKLFLAAAKGNKAKLRKLIGTEDVNLADSDGRTALLVATFSGTAKAVSMLLAASADPNAQFMDGCTALYLAAEFNYVGIARILLDHDADPDLGLERGGETPIHVAAERDHASIVEMLIPRTSSLDVVLHHGKTPVMCAADTNAHASLLLLLEAGADANYGYEGGPHSAIRLTQSALHYAVEQGFEESVRILVEHGAWAAGLPLGTDSSSGHTPLGMAASRPSLPILRLLIKHSEDVDHLSKGSTPLILAARAGAKDNVAALLEAGADPMSAGMYKVRTALSEALSKRHFDVAQLLVDAGASVNHHAENGLNELIVAVQVADYERIVWLLEAGASPAVEDAFGNTFFQLAVAEGFSPFDFRSEDESFDGLLSHLNDDGQDALFVATVVFLETEETLKIAFIAVRDHVPHFDRNDPSHAAFADAIKAYVVQCIRRTEPVTALDVINACRSTIPPSPSSGGPVDAVVPSDRPTAGGKSGGSGGATKKKTPRKRRQGRDRLLAGAVFVPSSPLDVLRLSVGAPYPPALAADAEVVAPDGIGLHLALGGFYPPPVPPRYPASRFGY